MLFPAMSCRLFFLCILVFAALALSMALTAQYVFDLEPCVLCLYERVPWALAGLVAVVWLVLPAARRRPGVGVALLAVGFVANAVLGGYHVGVEQGWWAFQGCTGEVPGLLGIADLTVGLDRPVRPACNVVQWSMFGLTFAGYNALVSLGMALACMAVLFRVCDGGVPREYRK